MEKPSYSSQVPWLEMGNEDTLGKTPTLSGLFSRAPISMESSIQHWQCMERTNLDHLLFAVGSQSRS